MNKWLKDRSEFYFYFLKRRNHSA